MKRFFRILVAAVLVIGCAAAMSPHTTAYGSSGDAAPLSSYNQALAYYNGSGAERDYAAAFEYFGRAAEEGVTEAWDHLGIMYQLGIGTAKDESAAAECFETASARGSACAELCLSGLWAASFDNLRYLLPGGAMDAYSRGMEFYYGVTVKQDYVLALDSFKAAAALYNPYGTYGEGLCLLHGNGTEKDVPAALEKFEEAAASGCAEAYERLVTIYSGEYPAAEQYADPKGLSRTRSRYNLFLTKAMDSGIPEYIRAAAASSLTKNRFVRETEADARYRSLFGGVIEQPESAAAYFASGVYWATCSNFGGQSDEETALAMFRRAAELGEPYAVQLLELMERESVREAVRQRNAAKLLAKQALAKDGETVSLTEKEREKVPTPPEVRDTVTTYLYNYYSTVSDYWLLYRNGAGEMKVRIVHIPTVQNGQLAVVYDRFTEARIMTADIGRSGYVSGITSTSCKATQGFSDCSFLGMYALNDTLSLFEDMDLPFFYRLFQQQYVYSEYMFAAQTKKLTHLSQEDLCTLYIDLIPAGYRPW